jgi:hypothetical protein
MPPVGYRDRRPRPKRRSRRRDAELVATDVVGDTSPVALAQNWIVLVARTR